MYGAAIAACKSGSSWEQALQLLEQMKFVRLKADVACLSAAASACEKGGQPKCATKLLSEILYDDGAEIGLAVVGHTAAISACESVSLWDRALHLFDLMQSRRHLLDMVAFGAAANACLTGARWERALQMIPQMRALTLQPGVIMYTVVLGACVRGGHWVEALSLLTLMRQGLIEPNALSFAAAVGVCSEGAQWERAFALLRKHIDLCAGAEQLAPTLLGAAVGACNRAGLWKLPLALLAEMQKKGIEPTGVGYGLASGVCEKRSQFGFTVALLQQANTWLLHSNVVTAAWGDYSSTISAFHAWGVLVAACENLFLRGAHEPALEQLRRIGTSSLPARCDRKRFVRVAPRIHN